MERLAGDFQFKHSLMSRCGSLHSLQSAASRNFSYDDWPRPRYISIAEYHQAFLCFSFLVVLGSILDVLAIQPLDLGS